MNIDNARDSRTVFAYPNIAGMAAAATVHSPVFWCGDPPMGPATHKSDQIVHQVRGPAMSTCLFLDGPGGVITLEGEPDNAYFNAGTIKTIWQAALPGGAMYTWPEILALAIPGVVPLSTWRSEFPWWRMSFTNSGPGNQTLTAWWAIRGGGPS